MIVYPHPFYRLTGLEVWWPEEAAEVVRLLPAAPLVSVMQCNEAVADGLRRYAFRHRPFPTLLVDLALPDAELWRGVHPRVRSYINSAGRLGCRVLVNERTDVVLALVNAFIRRRRFRPPLSGVEWGYLRERCDTFLAEYDGRAWAAAIVLVDPPRRARVLLGATEDRADPQYRGLVGPFNRYLFWQQFMHYKARGIRAYDLGGLEFDPASPLHSISRFKTFFGGSAVTEHKLRLTRNPLVRSLLRGAGGLRSAWQACHGSAVTTWLRPAGG
jgi:hypothetical protein